MVQSAHQSLQVQSSVQILVSELGDETFIIAAILAMKHPRAVVFVGALSALALMTVWPNRELLMLDVPLRRFLQRLAWWFRR